MRIFIAPLDFEATVDDVRDLFSPFGEVSNVIIPPNHARPWQSNKGFAFVDMVDPVAAQRAVLGLNGQIVSGKTLQVEAARGRSGGR